MKKPAICKSLPTAFLAAGICLCLLTNRALGQLTNYWDNNGASAATSGTWDTTTHNWTLTVPTLTASTVAFTNNNYALFAAGSTTISALTITVPGAVTCEGIGDASTPLGAASGAPVTTLTFSGAGSIALPTGEWPFECGVSANNMVFNVPITGSGGIIQHNNGTLSLDGNNTYSGGTLATGGQVIDYNNNNSFGTGPITNSAGGSGTSFLNTLGSLVTLPNAFYMNSGTTVFNFGTGNTTCTGSWFLGVTTQLKNNAASVAPLTISGPISSVGGAFGLTLECPSSSSATITLSGPNTYTGPTAIGVSGATTTVSVSSINSVTTPAPQASSSLGKPSSAANGTIAMGSAGFAGALIYTGSGETSDRVINLAGTTGGAIIEMDGAGPLKFTSAFTATGAGVKTLTLQGSSTAANTISGAIVNNSSGNTTALTKAQAGTWMLSGANTFTGGATISGGILSINAIADSGTSALGPSGTITLSGGELQYTGAGAATTTRAVTVSGTASTVDLPNGNLEFNSAVKSGTFTKTSAGTLKLSGTTDNSSLGVIVNAGTVILNKASSSSVHGVGVNTTVNSGGTLQLSGTGGYEIFSGVNLTVNSGGVVDVNGQNDTFASLTLSGIGAGSSGALINSAAGTTAALSCTVPLSANTSIGGAGNITLSNAISGAFALNYVGTGMLELLATNPYSGNTTISSGALVGVAGGSVSNSVVTVSSGATNSVLVTNNANQWSCGGLTFSSGTSVLDFNFGFSVPPSTSVAPLNVIGAATFTSTPVVTVEGGNIPPGVGSYPLMTWGSTSGTPPTTVTLPPHMTGSLSVSGNTLYLNVTSTDPIRWTGSAGNGLWDIATSQNWDDTTGTPTDYFQTALAGDSVLLDETYITASQAITLNTAVIPESITVSNTIYDYTISGAGAITGGAGLTKMGGGTLTLACANTYTGGTSNGPGSTLIIGGAGTITAAGSITNNGTFDYNSTTAETISGIISGVGTLNLNGTGGLTLSAANTYTGITAVTNGLLAITSDGNLGTIPGSAVVNQITLNSGTTGANYGLRVAANVTLNANRGITLGSSGAAIQVAAGDTLTYNGIITGGGNLYMAPNFNTGSGTLILGGANTYSGSTTIACGTLQLGANGALPSGTPVVVASSSNGGILNLTNFSQTIGTLSSSTGIFGTGTTIPAVELGTSGALTINETSSTTFAGAITGGASGSVTLNGGNNALTLTGTNTYASPTLISSGELIGVTGGSMSNSVVTVSGGATNSVSIANNTKQWSCGGLTFSSGTSALDFNFGSTVAPSTTVAPLNVVGAAAFTGTPIVTLEAGNIPFGTGRYPLMTWTSTSGTPPTTAILPAYVNGTLSVSGNTLYLNATNAQPLRWTGAAGNGLWDIATSQNWDDSTGTPTDYLETIIPGDAVVLDEKYITASAAITLNTVVTPASVTVSNTIYSYSISGTGGIAGSAGLTKLGSGTLTLACTNTYTGSTTNLAGTVVVGADNNLGTAPGSATVSSIVLSNSTLSADNTFTLNANRGITMLTNSTLDVAAGAQVTFTGIIAGPANLAKTSPGTLVLGGNNNSYSGNTIIAAGVLQTGGDHTAGGTASDLGLTPSTYAPTNITLAGGTLQGNNPSPGFAFNTNRGIVLLANSGLSCLSNDVMGIPGNITGNFGLTISNLGSGVVYLTGSNTYSGSTLIVAGLLSLQAGGSLSNSSISIAAAAGFDVSKLTITTYGMGGSSFTASGNGTVTNVGTANAAVINGAAGGSVSLGTLPVFLTFTPSAFTGDSNHPSLYVTQGTLQLNGNTFTVNNASGTALGAGTYVLIQQNGGSITSSGSYAVSVTGSGIVSGNAASISVSGTNVNLVVTWQPPTIANPALTTNTQAGVAWKIAITDLASAAGWSDPEGDPVTLSSVGPTSTNGISVTTDGHYIYYNAKVTAADQFVYTVTDGVLTANGNVNLVPVNQAGPSITSPTTTVNGNPTFNGFGIPGYVYGVESTTNLLGSPWIEAGTATAGSGGSWIFTDLTQTNPPMIFYRLYYPDDPSNPPQ